MALNAVPFNWFDIVLLSTLGFGMIHGRKNGMSKEILPVLKWLSLVLVCGHGYKSLAQIYMQKCPLDLLWADLFSYISLLMAVFFVFAILKRILDPYLLGSSVFGTYEYYFGMLAGMILFMSRLVVLLALLNAPYYTRLEIQIKKSYIERWWGSTYFPSLYDMQEAVFKTSLTGPYLKQFLGDLMIDTSPPPPKTLRHRTATSKTPGTTATPPKPKIYISPAASAKPAPPPAPAKPAAPPTKP